MIICAGFISSGTRLLHHIVDYYMDKPALHRSYPHWDRFWDWRDFQKQFGVEQDITWIVIERDPDYALRSAAKAGHPGLPDGTLLHAPKQMIRDWWIDWRQMSLTIPDPYLVSYEQLVREPQETIDRLAKYLGVPTPLANYPNIEDRNKAWDEAPRS